MADLRNVSIAYSSSIKQLGNHHILIHAVIKRRIGSKMQ